MNLKKCFLIFILSFWSTNCTQSSTSSKETTLVAKGDRVLGVHLTDPTNGFNVGYDSAKRIGFQTVNMHFYWGQGSYSGTLPGTPLETNSSSGCLSASTYDVTYLSIAKSFYPTQGKKISLTIGTYDGPNKLVPQCAASLSFNSSTMKLMFKYLLDNIFATINANPQLELESLVIGNEVDLHSDLGTCTTSPSLSTNWANYKEFFNEVAAYAKTYRPTLKIGITTTFAAATDSVKSACVAALTENADFISVTYYPLNSDFTMKSPTVVPTDFASIVSRYPNKPIYFQEIGYSSGSQYIGSSQNLQAQFYEQVFMAWDSYASSIPYISVVNTHEWSNSAVDGFGTQYNICPSSLCNKFKEYLQTLGLRTSSGDGADKTAFETILNQSSTRGW